MTEIPGLNLYRTDGWYPLVKTELQKKHPLKEKNHYVRNPLIVEEPFSSTGGSEVAELTLIRAILREHTVSIARAGTEGSTYTAMLLTFTVEAGDQVHTFTLYANASFPPKIHFDKNAPVEIFFMQGVLEIGEIK